MDHNLKEQVALLGRDPRFRAFKTMLEESIQEQLETLSSNKIVDNKQLAKANYTIGYIDALKMVTQLPEKILKGK